MSSAATRVKSNARYVCQECGGTEFVQGHHLVPGDDSTIICLCGECHSRKHPDVPRNLFFAKSHQPYWSNKSASSLARELGRHPRTIIRAARFLEVFPGYLAKDQEQKIRELVQGNHAKWRVYLGDAVVGTRGGSEFLFVNEVAALLHVSDETVYRLCRKGKLKASRVGNQWRVPCGALDELSRTEGVPVPC